MALIIFLRGREYFYLFFMLILNIEIHCEILVIVGVSNNLYLNVNILLKNIHTM